MKKFLDILCDWKSPFEISCLAMMLTGVIIYFVYIIRLVNTVLLTN